MRIIGLTEFALSQAAPALFPFHGNRPWQQCRQSPADTSFCGDQAPGILIASSTQEPSDRTHSAYNLSTRRAMASFPDLTVFTQA